VRGDRLQPKQEEPSLVHDEQKKLSAPCNRCSRADEMSDNANRDDFESGLKPLWTQAQAGDESAYRAALERIAARLRGYFGRRLQALPDEVEDLVQETLLALHLQRGTYDAALPVSAWVHAIARHKLVDLWRRRGRREALHDPLDELDESAHPLASDAQPARRDLGLLIETLPAAQQQAIVLTKIEGLSMAEASARTGVSVAALKVQVHRGLKRLAELVRDDA
jgi:RNA polymerase sigma-70 factor (ECF subfamily)